MTPRRFGWIPDLPDHRDFQRVPSLLKALPERVDLRPKCPPVLDQEDIGSCTANAISNAHRFDQMKQGVASPIQPSRLFTYWNARAHENTVESDSGCMIRDGFRSIVQQGVPSEEEWPYITGRFRETPPPAAYRAALDHQALVYRRVSQSIQDMQSCLAEGFPFVFGFTVYEHFDSDVANDYIANMPLAGAGVLGGHAVLCVGYDAPRRLFIIQNSWGTDWGYHGFFGMPYAYATDPDLSSDFWMMSVVE